MMMIMMMMCKSHYAFSNVGWWSDVLLAPAHCCQRLLSVCLRATSLTCSSPPPAWTWCEWMIVSAKISKKKKKKTPFKSKPLFLLVVIIIVSIINLFFAVRLGVYSTIGGTNTCLPSIQPFLLRPIVPESPADCVKLFQPRKRLSSLPETAVRQPRGGFHFDLYVQRRRRGGTFSARLSGDKKQTQWLEAA